MGALYHPRQVSAIWLVLLAGIAFAFANRLVGSPRPDGEYRAYRVPLNRAGTTELALIPGVGPALARRILVSRHVHGQFTSFAELQRVRGVGPVLQRRIARHASIDQ